MLPTSLPSVLIGDNDYQSRSLIISNGGSCTLRESQGRQEEDELKVIICKPRINKAWYEARISIKILRASKFRYTRLLRVAMRYAQLQSYMAWYSTLGGAHSSLGDRFGVHVSLLLVS